MGNTQLGPYNDLQKLIHQVKTKAQTLKISVDKWCNDSLTRLEDEHVDYSNNKNRASTLWVIKYMKTKYLTHFFDNNCQLNISLGDNYTWGDAVYVAPLYSKQDDQTAFTSAIFGRAGIVGYIPLRDVRGKPLLKVFDASKDRTDGTQLYLNWITQQQTVLFDHLTTSVHAQKAKYYLTRLFRWTFDIDLVFFNPDEYNEHYVDAINDHWFALSDWDKINRVLNLSTGSLPITIPTNTKAYTDKVKDCRWVIRVEEEFERNDSNYQYDLTIGKHIEQIHTIPPHLFRKNRTKIYQSIIDVYNKQPNRVSPHIQESEQLFLKISNSSPKEYI